MKAMSVLMLVLFFNVSITILSAMGVFVKGTDSVNITLIGGGTFISILGAGALVGIIGQFVGINPLSSIFFVFYSGAWTAGILTITGLINIGWFSALLIAVGYVLAFTGALQISTGGWQSYE